MRGNRRTQNRVITDIRSLNVGYTCWAISSETVIGDSCDIKFGPLAQLSLYGLLEAVADNDGITEHSLDVRVAVGIEKVSVVYPFADDDIGADVKERAPSIEAPRFLSSPTL
jgi:hypothetical protein